MTSAPSVGSVPQPTQQSRCTGPRSRFLPPILGFASRIPIRETLKHPRQVWQNLGLLPGTGEGSSAKGATFGKGAVAQGGYHCAAPNGRGPNRPLPSPSAPASPSITGRESLGRRAATKQGLRGGASRSDPTDGPPAYGLTLDGTEVYAEAKLVADGDEARLTPRRHHGRFPRVRARPGHGAPSRWTMPFASTGPIREGSALTTNPMAVGGRQCLKSGGCETAGAEQGMGTVSFGGGAC